MYGIRRNPLQRMEVIGHDAYGRPYVGAPRPVGLPGGYANLPPPPAPGSIDPATAVATLQQYGIQPPPAYQNYLPMQPPSNPGWRQGQLAPGVETPQEGMVPLPMAPQAGGGTFVAALVAITYQGQLQKPYRAERLLVSTVRTGASATGLLLAQVFVGVDLQQGDIQPLPIETLGAAGAFGTRLTLMQAPPGVLIRLPVTLSNAPTGTDSIFASIIWLGRILH